ncbi:uncharacterized protein PAE49_022908 [Odontesthes bonariensis]
MLETVVMEQFTEGLPSGTSAWVRCHRPADLATAITLAEDHLSVHSRDLAPEVRPTPFARPTPAPRRRPPQSPGPPISTATRPTPLPRSNQLSFFLPPQGQRAADTVLSPQTVPQAAVQECWRCGRPGHFRRECPLMEVGQVIRVVGPAAPSAGPGGTYSIP